MAICVVCPREAVRSFGADHLCPWAYILPKLNSVIAQSEVEILILLTIDIDNQAEKVKTALESAAEPIRIAAIENAEKRIEAQTQLMLAADARAISMMNVGISLVTISVAAVIALFENNLPQIAIAAIIAGSFAFVGAICCYWSAAPIDIHPVGWAPKAFVSDIGSSQNQFQASMAAYLGVRIDLNSKAMVQNSAKFQIGVWFILGTPLIFGGMTWMLSEFPLKAGAG